MIEIYEFDRFRLIKTKKRVPVLEYNRGDNEWVNLTDLESGKFLEYSTLSK